MSDDAAAGGRRGRLIVVTGSTPHARASVAHAVALRCERCVVVDGTVLDAMVVSGRDEPAAAPGLAALRLSMLRWSAAIATAETYQLEGFDVVVADDLLGDRLEVFLDLASPEPVHVVVLFDPADPPGTPPWGLRVGGPSADADGTATAREVLARLDEAQVLTDDAGQA